jgi:hypothetical protein
MLTDVQALHQLYQVPEFLGDPEGHSRISGKADDGRRCPASLALGLSMAHAIFLTKFSFVRRLYVHCNDDE